MTKVGCSSLLRFVTEVQREAWKASPGLNKAAPSKLACQLYYHVHSCHDNSSLGLSEDSKHWTECGHIRWRARHLTLTLAHRHQRPRRPSRKGYIPGGCLPASP